MDYSALLLDPVLTHAVGAALSVVLVVGAWPKLRDPAVFRAAVENYRLLPEALAGLAARLLPVCELAAGVLLLFPSVRLAGALLAVFLLLVVTSAVAINLMRGRVDIDCGCHGLAGHVGDQTLTWRLVVRNVVLVAAVLFALLGDTPRVLVWIDYLSVAGGTLALIGLYITANQVMANQPRLHALRHH